MDLGLRGKVALVTAASRGLGRAVAVQLAREGAHVAICARGSEDLKGAAADIEALDAGQVLAVPTDVSDPAAIEPLILIVMAFIVGTIAWAALVPIIQFSSGQFNG